MKRYLPLILIVILAAILRIGWLDKVPPSLSWDEVSLGYNAWSILKTGKDEYGNLLPLLFRAFDEYKLPGYIYTTAISEGIFGLNEFGVRFPSAFFGTLTVVLVYFLVKELFKDSRLRDSYSLFAAFLLAINPWHINFSRGAFETNLSLFFFVAGMFLIFKALKKPALFLAAAVFLIASIYTYYTTRIVIPLVLLSFALIYKKQLFTNKRWVIVSGIVGLLLLLPILKGTLGSSGGFARVSQVSIFVHERSLVEDYAQEILRKEGSLLARILYNRRLAYFLIFAENYLKSFAFDFLFINGVWMSGLLYLWEIVFLPIGLVKIFGLRKRWKWIILTWFLATPIAGGLSIGAPNAFRNLPNAVVMAIFSGCGLVTTIEWLKKRKGFRIGAFILGVTIIFFFIRFCFLYFDYTPVRKALDWGDGYKQLAFFLEDKQDEYDRIWVSGEYWRPYIHLLFHLKYDPALYHQGGSPFGFGVFRFGKADWDQEGIDLGEVNLGELIEGKTMFVLSSKEYESQKEKKKKFSLELPINGRFTKEVFWAVEL